MSLAIADLRGGNSIAVRCAHGTVIAIVLVHLVPNRLRPNLKIRGTAVLPLGTLENQIFTSTKLLGMPWGVSWRTMSHIQGSKNQVSAAKCGCDFLLPTPL